jgi:hypothetical protein
MDLPQVTAGSVKAKVTNQDRGTKGQVKTVSKAVRHSAGKDIKLSLANYVCRWLYAVCPCQDYISTYPMIPNEPICMHPA